MKRFMPANVILTMILTTVGQLLASSDAQGAVTHRFSRIPSLIKSFTQSMISDNSTKGLAESLIEGPDTPWEGGSFPLDLNLKLYRKRIENLSTDEKTQLLTTLLEDSRWQKQSDRFRLFIQMLLNHETSWLTWVMEIRNYGLRQLAPFLIFEKTIEQMPESLRSSIIHKIADVYDDSKESLKLHPYLDFRNPENLGLTLEARANRPRRWFKPKRIFDLMIHMMSGAVAELYEQMENKNYSIETYNKYLFSVRSLMKGTRGNYSAEDVLAVGLAMQKELRQIISKLHIPEAKAEVYIYGSFPNGLANINGNFDFDLAVSTIEITMLSNEVPDDFHRRLYGISKEGSHSIEVAGLNALKKRTGIIGYDPRKEDHGVISVEKLEQNRLNILSPVLLKITPIAIELVVRKPEYRVNSIFPTFDKITGYSFRSPYRVASFDQSGSQNSVVISCSKALQSLEP